MMKPQVHWIHILKSLGMRSSSHDGKTDKLQEDHNVSPSVRHLMGNDGPQVEAGTTRLRWWSMRWIDSASVLFLLGGNLITYLSISQTITEILNHKPESTALHFYLLLSLFSSRMCFSIITLE